MRPAGLIYRDHRLFQEGVDAGRYRSLSLSKIWFVFGVGNGVMEALSREKKVDKRYHVPTYLARHVGVVRPRFQQYNYEGECSYESVRVQLDVYLVFRSVAPLLQHFPKRVSSSYNAPYDVSKHEIAASQILLTSPCKISLQVSDFTSVCVRPGENQPVKNMLSQTSPTLLNPP